MDDDAASAAALERDIDPTKHRVLVAEGLEDAEQLLRSRDVDVLLVDHRLEAEGPTSLVALSQASARNVAAIVMMSEATAKDAADALDAGAAAVLDRPFTVDELEAAIDRAAGAGFRGNLEGISLVDMLQVFHIGRRSLIMAMGGDPPTRIWFERGEIVHAERGELRGEDVLVDVLEARTGAIRTLPFEEAEATIDRPFQSLMLDILRSRDESLRSAPDDERSDISELSDGDFSEDLLTPEPAEPSEPPRERPPPNGSRGPADLATGVPAAASAFGAAVPPEATPDAATALPARPLDPICAAVNAEIPGALATALVDLERGTILGIENRAPFTPDFERFVALYTRSIYRGPEMQHIERTMSARRGIGGGAFLEEVVFTSRHTHHLTKSLREGRVAVMVVTPRRADAGATMQRLRALAKGIESNLP